MILQIENQFEQFVKASVTAIESRDPATSGHSFRVSAMCVNMAGAISRQQSGSFAQYCFTETEIRELEFAGLLHDFGKVYIEPAIFLKGKKLYHRDFDFLTLRYAYLYRSIELAYLDAAPELDPESRQREKQGKLVELKQILKLLSEMNEPTVMSENPESLIRNIRARESEFQCSDLEGKPVPLLTEYEINNLKTKRGTLNADERHIIENHVNYTYTFVEKIPWPQELINIPDIVRKHHERLDGSGYPLALKGKKQIPMQARIMAIADVFDALAAADRPYKKAVPLDRVFQILREEATQNCLDSELVELLISEKAYDLHGETQP